jgi:hypothetical protein
LLDLTTAENEYYLQSGKTQRNDPQPTYYPFSEITVHTDRNEDEWLNITNLYFSFPQVWVNVSPPGNSTPGPSPAIFLYMPKMLDKQPVLQNSFFGTEKTMVSTKYSLASTDTPILRTTFQIPLKAYKPRRLLWI